MLGNRLKMIAVMSKTIRESSSAFFEAVEQRFLKIENHFLSLLPTKPSNLSTSKQLENDFVTDILKNQITELENQLADNAAVINFLSSQLAKKNRDASNIKEVFTNSGKNCCSCGNSTYRNKTTNLTLRNDKRSNCNEETVTNIDNNNTVLQVNFDNHEITSKGTSEQQNKDKDQENISLDQQSQNAQPIEKETCKKITNKNISSSANCKRIYIIADSIIKHVQGYELSKSPENVKTYVFLRCKNNRCRRLRNTNLTREPRPNYCSSRYKQFSIK